ncbi:unnamed protein product, partial [marine sediment metagenome]
MKIIKKIFNLIKEYYKFILITALIYLLFEIFNGSIPIAPRLFTRYYMQIIMFCLINIMMTVSLNLINGF